MLKLSEMGNGNILKYCVEKDDLKDVWTYKTQIQFEAHINVSLTVE